MILFVFLNFVLTFNIYKYTFKDKLKRCKNPILKYFKTKFSNTQNIEIIV